MSHIPEFTETNVGEALGARTSSLPAARDLGPPDLAHLLKNNAANRKESGSYHHVLGVDPFTSASIAAYLTSLTYAPSAANNKVVRGTYCCWNALSNVDLRVEVRIPGGVEAWAIDERGEKRTASEELWQETYLCAVLRAILYTDNPSYHVHGCRKFNPLPNLDTEQRFFSIAEKLFFRGPSLGSESHNQVPSVVSNYLVSGLKKYVRIFRRFDMAVNLFEKLAVKDPEVNALLAGAYLEMDEEVRAVRLLHQTLLASSSPDPGCLLLQSEFLSSKSKHELALEMGKRAVNAAPAEFMTWKRLAECFIAMERYEDALLCLNSCPMFTYNEPPMPRMPPPAKVYLPIPTDAVLDDVEHDPSDRIDPTLVKLPAPALRGTFKEAYTVLTAIVKQIGWDALLKARSHVFVMEEEYRSEKSRAKPNGELSEPLQDRKAESDAQSDRAVKSANSNADSEKNEHENEDKNDKENDKQDGGQDNASGEADAEIHKPHPLIASHEPKPVPENGHCHGHDHVSARSFVEKRLCERWLDNLFMVLYEDLRVFTIWRAEVEPSNSQEMAYRKSCLEHEILGELAMRLHREPEALESFRNALQIRFSSKSWRAIVTHRDKSSSTPETLEGIIRLIVFSHRWYEQYNPTILEVISKLIVEEGPVKVKSRIAATKFNPEIVSLVESWIGVLEAFGVGSE